MKIFISHASANKEYGFALVELLRGVGIKEDEIIFTSNTAYGIPIGQNIFNWLKSQILEKPFVIYLLSKEYYASIACLNEMGAAWIIENEHAILFVPNFQIDSKEFQNGAIDPREIGFYISDEEKVISFIHQLEKNFQITKHSVLILQNVRKYLATVAEIETKRQNTSIQETKKVIDVEIKTAYEKPKLAVQSNFFETAVLKQASSAVSKPSIQTPVSIEAKEGTYDKFVNEVLNGKLKDEELLLIHYIIETSRSKLMTGWQEDLELKEIKTWEEVSDLKNTLSLNYSAVIRKFSLRKYTEVSAITGGGNPKEVKLKPEIETNILDLPNEVLEAINSALERNKGHEAETNGMFSPDF